MWLRLYRHCSRIRQRRGRTAAVGRERLSLLQLHLHYPLRIPEESLAEPRTFARQNRNHP
jgi:hypothetical protein